MSQAPSDFAVSLAAARAKGPTGTQKSSIIPELSGQGVGLPGWSHFIPPERELAELWIGRKRTETVEGMLNHFQVAAVRQAIRLPAHRYVIELDPQDCDAVASDLIAHDLDVPLLGSDERRTGRRAKRFSERRHRDRAMDALDYGHAAFETPGYIDAAGYWRLTDLSPIPQWTIDDSNSWEVDRHGQLIQVIQWGSNPPVKIPVDHLVLFTWQGKPGDPRGRSMLRPLTGAWLQHDRTMRVMGMSAERTGMGIPVGRVPSAGAVSGAKQKMEQLLAGLAAGHDTNLVLETDEDITKSLMLMGVSGSTPDLPAMLKYYDEAIARAMLAMLIQLGQTQTGSRALGGTFDDLLAMFHDTIIDWYCDVMTEQLVEPWIDRNRGEDAPAPRLVWSRREDGGEPEDEPESDTGIDTAAQDRAPVAARRGRERGTAVAARRQLRARQTQIGGSREPVGAKAAAPGAGTAPTDGGTVKVATRRDLQAKAKATRAAFMATTGRDLRRDPTEIELAAATDFATIESQFVATRSSVATALVAIRDELTSTAVEQVAVMEQVDPLTLGQALAPILDAHVEEMDAAPLVALLVAFAAAGVNQVIGEAARQGVALQASIDYRERAEADAADLMRRMARQVEASSASAARAGVPAGSEGWPAAQTISDHLGSLTSAAVEQAAAGAASRAQNAGRAAAIEAGSPTTIAASEVLDLSTCDNCLLADGREYPSLSSALAEYPAGGYVACDGMERCRGLLVAVFQIEPEEA